MRIAIVKLSALGDIVHAMVVLQFIKRFNKEILIDWVVDENYKELLDKHPDINQVFTTKLKQVKKNKSVFQLLTELSKVRKLGPYDIVIDLQGLFKSAIISKLIPSKKTIGFDKESIRERFASLFYSHKFNFAYENNVIERNSALIEFALELSISRKQLLQKAPFLFTRIKQLDIKQSLDEKNLLNPGKVYPILKKCVEEGRVHVHKAENKFPDLPRF